MGYTKEALKGVSWVWALRLLTRSFSFLRVAVVARLLTPSLFGLYGIASLVLSFVEVFTETGINIFIIQEKENLKRVVNTAWIVSIVRGIVIFLVILVSTPLVVMFFNSPDASHLIFLISLVPLIRGFISPSIVRFQQDLEFHKEFFFRGSLFILESLAAILFVYLLKTPAGIIYGLIIGAVVEVIISFAFVKPIPVFMLDKSLLKKLLSRGKWLTAGGIFNYLYHNADDAIVGRVMGAGSLGVYDMAYRLSMLPITEVGDTVSKVIFPVYSKISDDNQRLKSAFIKTMIAVSVFTIPIGLAFYFLAAPIVNLVLGSKWSAAIPVFQVLAIFGVIRTLINPIFSIYLSKKKQEYNTIVSLISFLVMIVSITPLMTMYGLPGAGWAVVLGSLLSLPFAIYFLVRIFK